jgi:hypothetical protein
MIVFTTGVCSPSGIYVRLLLLDLDVQSLCRHVGPGFDLVSGFEQRSACDRFGLSTKGEVLV